jgi:hypothetical protein
MANSGRGPGRPPKDESPEQRLERVFAPRVARIIDDLRQLPNMTRAEYGPPSEAQIEYVIETVERQFAETKELLRRPDPRRLKSNFSFFDDKRGVRPER